MTEYSVLCEYVDGQMDKVRAGKEMVLEIRDLATFERKVVRAIISPSPEDLADSDLLKIEDYGGDLKDELWAIKVIEELDPDEVESTPLSSFRKER